MHAEDAGLGGIEDGCGEQRAEDAAVGDGEGAALHVRHRQLAVPCSAAVFDDGVLDLMQPQGVGVAHDRHHQAAVGADGDAHVVVAVVDDVVAVDAGVDGREALQRLHRGAHEEAHEAELGAVVPRLELVAVAAPHGHHRLHVHFVEGGEHGGGLLRFDQALGDAGPQAGHGNAAFGAFLARRWRPRRRGFWADDGFLLRRSLGRAVAAQDVGLGHAAVPARALHLRDVDIRFRRQLARRRRQALRASHRTRCGCGAFLRLDGFAGRGAFLFRFGQPRQQVLGLHHIAFRLENLRQHAVGGREDLDHHFVGFDVHQHVVAPHGIADALVPCADGAFGNRLGEGRRLDLNAHAGSSCSGSETTCATQSANSASCTSARWRRACSPA